MKKTKDDKIKTASRSSKKNTKRFPIVAIGGSAGGLEAITALLKELDPDTGMAYIYVQHLSPDHKSMLSSILAKTTSMTVEEVVNKVLIQPNHLYVIPPDKEMNVDNGHIILTPRPEVPKHNLPIDILFTSLANSHKENVIGIILSGSASDGKEGMKEIKQIGGLTFAQNESAKFNSMPKAAIAAGVVDFILSPEEIAHELNLLSNYPFDKNTVADIRKYELIEDGEQELKKILNQLHKATGVDFHAYKMQTVKRRIIRRMFMHNLKSLKQYVEYIKNDKEELDILYQDLLINVTSFFRDRESHKYLKSSLFPQIIKSKKKDDYIRIWVPACSTGEEAFSIAMMLLELQESKATKLHVQIFATDLSEKAIKKARIGVYSKTEIETVSPKRIQRFFTKKDDAFRVDNTIREMCIFAQHNLLTDPPFSRIDFISCRNLLIYLDTPAQKSALSTFHYALNEGGYLMLGKSESIISAGNLFSDFHNKFKIFTRKNTSGVAVLPNLFPKSPPINLQQGAPVIEQVKKFSKAMPQNTSQKLDTAIDKVLILEYMPSSVVINHQMEILQFRGNTDAFLKNAPGKATLNVLKMARPELAFALRNSIGKVIKSKKTERKSGILVKIDSTLYSMGFEVSPLKVAWLESLILVVFFKQEQSEYLSDGDSGEKEASEKDNMIKKLEDEYATIQADALAFSIDQEAYIEELQSANEEVVSSNEELQTINEELETSKEEIVSTNEELITTNQELQSRNELLSESYEYAEAIITTLHEPLIVLNKDFRVRTANNAFCKTFDIKEDEIEGELLYDLGNKKLNIPALHDLLEVKMQKNESMSNYEIKHPFPDIGEKVLLLNVNKILQKSQGEQLILVSINDITEIAKLQEKEKEKLEEDIEVNRLYSKQLEEAVKKRTAELKEANTKLTSNYVELEDMNKQLKAFTYIASHDLQEPLRKIQTFTGRILEKELKNMSDSGKTYFEFIQYSAGRLQMLVKDLLAFSLLTSSEIKFEKVVLSEIVEEIILEFKDRKVDKDVQYTIDVNCMLKIVPFQFHQLLYNLMSNSFKFAKIGEPLHIKITDSLIKAPKSNKLGLTAGKSYCCLSFSDNGIGIEKEYFEKVFKAFQKLHTKDTYPGSGIGLAIVKRVVDNHKGVIDIKSTVNEGTTFDIYIPH